VRSIRSAAHAGATLRMLDDLALFRAFTMFACSAPEEMRAARG
jgi:hypothetical protein